MGRPAARLFGRRRSVHELLGGGFAADAILWRRSDVAIGALAGAPAARAMLEMSGHTLISLLSTVLLLLLSTLFLWSKCAELLNRPPPPVPDLRLTEEAVAAAAALVRDRANAALSLLRDIALGKDPKRFRIVAVCLSLLSVAASFVGFLSFVYLGLVALLTVPAMYERFEGAVDGGVMVALAELHVYERVYAECFGRAKGWLLESLKDLDS